VEPIPRFDELTTEEAVAIYDSEAWREWSLVERAKFQLFTTKLCMPFDVFHEAIEEALGRGVWTHEFGLNHDGLVNEFLGVVDPPTMKEIMELIPEEKRIVLRVGAKDD
jgi:hypothetical protein